MDTAIQERLCELKLSTVTPRSKLLDSAIRRKSHLLDLDGQAPDAQVPSPEIAQSINTITYSGAHKAGLCNSPQTHALNGSTPPVAASGSMLERTRKLESHLSDRVTTKGASA